MSSQTVEIQEKQQKGLAWHVLKRYFEYSKGYRWMILGTITTFALGTLIDHAYIPFIASRIFDRFAAGDMQPLDLLAALAGGWVASQWIIFRMFDYFISTSQSNIMKVLDGIAIRHILKNEAAFFKNTSSGATDEKARRLSEAYEGVYDSVVFNFLPAMLKCLAAVAISTAVHAVFGIVVFVWSALFLAIALSMTIKRSPMYRKLSSLRSSFRAVFGDIVRHGAFIDLAGTRTQEARYVDASAKKVATQRLSAWHKGNKQWALQGLLVSIISVGYFALVPHFGTTASIGDLMLVYTMISLLTGSIWQISNNYDQFVRNVQRAQQMFEIIDREPPIVPFKPGVSPKNGDIVFDDVTLRYHDSTGNKTVFHDFSMRIPQGQNFALVGPSGSGKTTLVQALMRALDPLSGSIAVGGIVSTDVERDLWRRELFAFVPQDPSLFDRSLREMIAYGVDDANEDDIIEAAKKAQAHEFIMELPNGYDSVVGERGVKLSGGQRQRILIAQAFFKKKPILILDEATSSLDTLTELKIKKAIEQTEGMTVIAIAHRLSTVENFDRICVLDEGEIVQCGTHDELVAQDGLYRRLHDGEEGL